MSTALAETADNETRKKLTPAKIRKQAMDAKATANLRKLWERYRDENKNISQETFAREILGWNSQGNFSQYLNGLPIGPKPLRDFCQAFSCEPGDIREEYRSRKEERLTQLLNKASQMLTEMVGGNREVETFKQELQTELSAR